MADPPLTALVESVDDILFGCQARNVLSLQVLDHLDRVEANVVRRSHDANILYWPVRADEDQEAGHTQGSEVQLALMTDYPLVSELDTISINYL